MDEEYEMIEELFGSNEETNLTLSFSRISDYDRNGPKALDKRTIVRNEGAKIGSITDDWLFNKDNFDDIYFVFNGEKPTATLGKLVDIILDNYANIPPKEEVLNIIERNDFWKRSKPETVVGYFDTPEFWGYLKAMFKGRERQLITTSEFALGQELATVLTTHDFSKHFFINDYEQVAQKKFTFTYKGVQIRGIIDLILIDHKAKTIKFVDLKTGADIADNFLTSYIKYRYYFQAALYQMAFTVLAGELNAEGYTLEPFSFLYIGRKEQLPLEYVVSQKWIDAAWDGFTTLGGYEYKGIDVLLDEIDWHWNNKVFDMPREAYEANGKVYLKDNFFSVTDNK